MKIGRERTPLTERLNEKASNQADQAADLMASHLKRFESDCMTSLNAVRNTIENDTQSLLQARAQMNRRFRSNYLTAVLTSLVAIMISFAVNWFWAVQVIEKGQSASPWSLGLTINHTNGGLVLSWDENRVRLIECRIGTASAKCLQILEKE